PVAFSARALERRVECRSFYLDLGLLLEYWKGRKYHHTISAPLVYVLAEALNEVEDEGLEARWQRHQDGHTCFVESLERIGVQLRPPAGDRLWSLNRGVVPDGVDEAQVRRAVREREDIEIGAGLGPLAGRIVRVGLMGSGATRENA